MTAGPDWYAASMKQEGFSLLVSGSTRHLQIAAERISELPSYGDRDLPVNRAEGIAELVFRAYGAVYTVSVECEDFENDRRCAEDSYARDIARGLVLSNVNRR